MSSIKNIRESLGLNQEDLAVYLNISRSLVAAAETKRKELPTPALLKLTALHQSLPQNIAAENLPLLATELAAEKNNLNNFLQQHSTKRTQQKKHLQKQLTAMQSNYANTLKFLQTIRTLKNNLPNTKQNKKDILWCAAVEASVLEKIKTNGLVEQEKLKIKIASL